MSIDSVNNFVTTLVETPPSPFISGTSMFVRTGDGALMPTPPFNLTVSPPGVAANAYNAEIVRVTAISGDQITNMTRGVESSIIQNIQAGWTVNQSITAGLIAEIEAAIAAGGGGGGGGGGAVSSVFGRTGAVIQTIGDYGVGQVTGAAPSASPSLTGTPTAPTAPALTNSTQISTTAYTDAAVSVEKARAIAVEVGFVSSASPALTGTPTAPTNSTVTDSTTQIATDAFVQAAVTNGATGGPSIFTASGTWTPSTTGQQLFMATVVGGGGGSGVASTTYGAGGGGGGEVLANFYLGHVTTSQTITIGAGGTPGNSGGNTTIGSLATAKGGFAGSTQNGGPGGACPQAYNSTSPGAGGQGSSSTNGSFGYSGLFRFGSGGGGGGFHASTGGVGGGPLGATYGAGVTGAGGGGGSGDAGSAGGAGVGTVGGAGGSALANSGSGGGGGGAGTTPGAGGNGGSGYIIVWQVA